MSTKMDRAGVRTPAQLEQKYAFGKLGKSFAEAMGVAEDARIIAEDAKDTADKANDELENLFANDINMTGTFTNNVKAFLYPGEPELDFMRQAFLADVTIPAELVPLYDFNSDGKVDGVDLLICQKAAIGIYDLSTWAGAKETDVTLTIDLKNPEKAIHFTGKNMWGREIEGYIGINFTSVKNPETEQMLNKLNSVTTLWSGALSMSDTQFIRLSEPVSDQPNGIVLVFSPFSVDSNETGDYYFHYFFVPKSHIVNHEGESVCFQMSTRSLSIFAVKELFISDSVINGSESNVLSGISECGIKYTNTRFVLRYVIGV